MVTAKDKAYNLNLYEPLGLAFLGPDWVWTENTIFF